MAPRDNTVLMEGVRIIFRNFEGKEGQYNRKGDRNFGVLLSDEVAEAMIADGWNVKFLKPRDDAEEDEQPQPWLPVSLKYGKTQPPRVVMITSRGRTNLSEELVDTLDWVEIQDEGVDLIVRPYNWEVNGKTGTKAYLKAIYVKIEEDELELKYNHLPLDGATPEEPEDGVPF